VAELELSLEAPRPYHLERSLAGQRMGRSDPALRRAADGSLAWALGTPAGPVALRLAQSGTRVGVEAWGGGVAWLRERLPALLGFCDDLSGFAPEHPALRRLWRELAGQRLPRRPAVFERLMAIVLLQRVTSPEAHDAWRRLVRAHGSPAPGPAGLLVPPGPERVARLPSFELIGLGVPHRQATTLLRLARQASRLERAAARGREALSAALAQVPGVGPWSVQYALGSALGDPDAVLVGDDNLHDSVAWVLAGEERATDARMLELLEPYRGHRFRVIRLVWASGRRAPRRGPGRRLSGPRLDRPPPAG